jgi:hypothetical protein
MYLASCHHVTIIASPSPPVLPFSVETPPLPPQPNGDGALLFVGVPEGEPEIAMIIGLICEYPKVLVALYP